MTIITLKEMINGQNHLKETRYADERFIGDYEPIEFSQTDYSYLKRIDTDSIDYKNDNKLVEKVVGTIGEDFYLITATTTIFAGEKQTNYIRQQLTLKGFNSFTREDDIPNDVYNNYLHLKGYELTLDDVIEFGEYKPEFGESTILQFTDEEGNFHTITVNKFKQLSKVTVKQTGRKVNSNSSISSAFGF